MLWITLVLFLVGESLAQVPSFGSCPDLQTLPNFNVTRYVGKWYEQERYFTFFQFGGKCVTADYSLSESGTVKVHNKQLTFTGTTTSIDGVARFKGRSDDAKLTVVFPSLPISVDAPYWILDADYDKWALVWSCVNFGFLSLRYSWILTREQHPPVSVMEKVYAAVDRNQIARGFYTRTDQRNCPSGI